MPFGPDRIKRVDASWNTGPWPIVRYEAVYERAGLCTQQIDNAFAFPGGTELSFLTAGEATDPAVLLLGGFHSSSRTFRDVLRPLFQVAYVIAPDLPGFGDSDVLLSPSFHAFSKAVMELLAHLSVGPRYIYLHDFGAPGGLHITMQDPGIAGQAVDTAASHRRLWHLR